MFKKFFAVLLVLALAISLTGCGRHRGSGNPAAPEAPKSPSILLSTKIEKPTSAAPSTSVRGAIRASTAALTNAVVEIFLADGKTTILKEDPTTPGLYHLEASDEILAMSYPFAINAKKGAVLIQAVITKQTEVAGGLITCDYISTAVVQAAQLNANNATVTDFTALLADANSITYIENLKEIIIIEADDLPAVIVAIIAAVQNAIFNASETGTAPAPANLDTYKVALDALPTPDVRATEKVVTNLAKDFIDLFIKAHNKADITEEEKAIISEDFILSGFHKEGFLGGFEAKILLYESTLNEFDIITKINTISNSNLSLEKLSDDLYLVHLNGTMDLINQDNENKTYQINSTKQGYRCNQSTYETFTNFEVPTLFPEFSYFPIMVRKEDTSWKIIGNQVKIEQPTMRMNRNFVIMGNRITDKVCTIGYKFDLQNFSASTKTLWVGNDEIPTISEDGFAVGRLEQELEVGQTYKIKVSFGETTQTYTRKVSYIYPISKNMFTIIKNPESNTVTMTWPKIDDENFIYYEYDIHVMDNSHKILVESSNTNRSVNENSVTIKLSEGKNIADIAKIGIRLIAPTKSAVNNQITYTYEEEI
jgi:hypothetical protein